MKKFLTIISIMSLTACSIKTTDQNYSQEFIDNFKNSEILLRSDSLLIPVNDTFEVVLLPTQLTLNKQYTFVDKEGNQNLKVKRTNYTDIEFEINYKEQLTTGKASISPQFYFGAESVETSEGAFWISQYFVTESTTNCLYLIGIGNQSISEEHPTNLYAYLDFESNCTTEKIFKTSELLWSKK
ncbi:MAG: hypothetical protein AB2L20_21445 [Mangrovibacterium sp.]